MRSQFKKQQQSSTIIYGEPLAASLPTAALSGKHVLVVTNQKYYDHFFDKISRVLQSAEDLDWYIVTNQVYCNNLNEMMDLLSFLEKFPENKEYLLIGFGNEGVMQLVGFLQQTIRMRGNYWTIPASVRALASCLTAHSSIVKKGNQAILQVKNLPEFIFYDQTISEGQKDGKLVDFLTLIRCGLVCDYPFLQNLYRNFPTSNQIETRSFTALLQDVLRFYQETSVETFGSLFEQAFYETENGHLLSANMKRLYGVIFQLFWSDCEVPLNFQLENFMKWLSHLGYPIHLPQQLSLSEYCENVVKLSQRTDAPIVLTAIGKIGGRKLPRDEALIAMMQKYQQILNKI